MSLSHPCKAIVLLLSVSLAAQGQQGISSEANDQLKTAQDTLTALRPYVKLDDVADALADVDSARKALAGVRKGTPEYADKFERYKHSLANFSSVFESRVRNLGDPKSFDNLLKSINWDHQSFVACAHLPVDAVANPEPPPQRAHALSDEAAACQVKLNAARKTIQTYIEQQDRELVRLDKEIAQLTKEYNDSKDETAKARLKQQLEQLQTERQKVKEKRNQAEQVKKSLSLGDILLALGEIALGIVGAVACADSGDAETCIAATGAIAHGVKTLTDGGKEETVNKQIEVEVDAPRDQKLVDKENALKSAAGKPLANTSAPSEYAKDNPGLEVIPADSSTGLMVTQKFDSGAVSEVSFVDAATKTVLLTVTDANLFVTSANADLASLRKFPKFTGASTQSNADKNVWFVELRGLRQDGKAGDILLRIAPLHPSGKVVAVGE